MQKNKKKQHWSPQVLFLLDQEMGLLTSLYSQFTSKKWKKISEEFRLRGFNRSEIDCREKWVNFLDPSINKKEWEEEQLQRLYDLHAQVGTCWCLIQKEIGRTQNQIKNRFYGTLRNFIRFVMNYFDSNRTCYNFEISKLSPKFLSDLYNSQNNFVFMEGEIQKTIYEMKFIVNKKYLTQRVRENRALYSRMHQTVFQAFQNLSRESPQRQQMGSEELGEMSEAVEVVRIQEVLIKRQEPLENVITEPVLPFQRDWTYQDPMMFQMMQQWMQFHQSFPNNPFWFA